MNRTPRTASLALVSLMAAASLAACNRTDSPRAQRPNDTVTAQADRPAERSAERSAERAADSAGDATRDAGRAAGNAADAVGNKARDMAISTEVNMRLARDPQLSALGINVDTSEGHVVLRGQAPDAASRTRAAELARGVDGVRDVVNELSLQR